MDDRIQAEKAAWLEGRIGEFETVRSFRAGSARTAVWQLRGARGDYVFKLHYRQSHWAAERFAYDHWTYAVAPYAPTLVAASDDGLLLTFVPGDPLRERPDVEGTGAYRTAGSLLRRLHGAAENEAYGIPTAVGGVMDRHGAPGGTPVRDAPTQKADDLEELADGGKALNVLTEAQARAMREGAYALRRTPAYPAVPTHPDYTPGNWLVGHDGVLAGLIDFENMAWGHPADSLPRLILDYFPFHPARESAFYEGYGYDLAQTHPEWVRAGCLIYAGYYATLGGEAHRERAACAFDRLGL